jgi:hypothetical protein
MQILVLPARRRSAGAETSGIVKRAEEEAKAIVLADTPDTCSHAKII